MDVGEALTGLRRMFKADPQPAGPTMSPNVEDRREEPWPTASLKGNRGYLPQTLNHEGLMERLDNVLEKTDVPPVTALSRDAGARDVERPSPEEVMRFLANIEMLNPEAERPIEGHVPTPRPRPKGK